MSNKTCSHTENSNHRHYCPSCKNAHTVANKVVIMLSFESWMLAILFCTIVMTFGAMTHLGAKSTLIAAFIAIVPTCFSIFKKFECMTCGVEFDPK